MLCCLVSRLTAAALPIHTTWWHKVTNPPQNPISRQYIRNALAVPSRLQWAPPLPLHTPHSPAAPPAGTAPAPVAAAPAQAAQCAGQMLCCQGIWLGAEGLLRLACGLGMTAGERCSSLWRAAAAAPAGVLLGAAGDRKRGREEQNTIRVTLQGSIVSNRLQQVSMQPGYGDPV
jgi:hypothetical protein